MSLGFKPYPEMKDSGVQWLGQVPAHWKVARLKDWVDTNQVVLAEETHPDYEFNYVDIGSVGTGKLTAELERIRFENAPSRARRVLRTGDTIVSTVRTYLKAVWHAESVISDLVASTGFAVLTPRANTWPKFVSYYCQSEPFTTRVTAESIGVAYPAIAETKLGTLAATIPPAAEQAAIARFLEHADRRFQRYIRAKQKLIALLEEQKQTITHHLVTRGVGGESTQETTGDPWFPRVPANWNVMTMRRVITKSVDGPHHSPEYLDEGIPFLSARNIKVDGWSLADVKFISQDDYETFCKRVKPEVGDVLYTKGGTTGVARAVDLDHPFQVWVHVAVLKLDLKRILPRYLTAALNSPRCYEQSQLHTRGATNQDLGLGRMKEIVLPVPPIDDQTRVIPQIDTVEQRIHLAVRSALRAIELLQEFRTRLIADVVCGKIDVREAAANLPDLDPLVAGDESSESHEARDAPAANHEEALSELAG